MQKFPESVDPTPEQKTFEALSMDQEEYNELEFIRRNMRYILKQEQQTHGNEEKS